MGKILPIIFLLLLHGYFCSAQQEDDSRDIEAVRTAYINNQLKLTPEEAQRFWPIYNNYINEIKKAKQETDPGNDVVAFQERLVNIRKKYKVEFRRVVGSEDRVNRVYTAEGDLHKMLINEWRNRHPNGGRAAPFKRGVEPAKRGAAEPVKKGLKRRP